MLTFYHILDCLGHLGYLDIHLELLPIRTNKNDLYIKKKTEHVLSMPGRNFLGFCPQDEKS
jgi:hypothetical protein